MQTPIIAALLVTSSAITYAQVTFNNGTFLCPGIAAISSYCAGDSLTTNIIIRCSGPVGQPGNCNDNLAGVPPIGVKTFAPCYQTSLTAGDAACSYNGRAFPDVGPAFNISTGPSPPNNSTSTPPAETSPAGSDTSPSSPAGPGSPSGNQTGSGTGGRNSSTTISSVGGPTASPSPVQSGARGLAWSLQGLFVVVVMAVGSAAVL